jgi:glycosyltransferase involved in cell wall biosynthesis
LEQVYKVIQYGVYPYNPDLIKGGMEASVYGLTHSLLQQAHIHVKVITYPDKQCRLFERINPATNFELVRLPNRHNYEILSVLSLVSLIREIRNYGPDVCHLHGTTLLVFLISLYLRVSGKNYVVTVHGIASVEYTKAYQRSGRVALLVKKWLYGFVELLLINFTQKLVVDTEYVKNWIVKYRMRSCKQVIIAPQGVDERYYYQFEYIDTSSVVSIGAISERKGFEYAIRAFKQVQETLPEVHFYIIGFLNDRAYYDKLIALIDKLSLGGSVHMIVDANQDELLEYLQKAAVFVLHSHEESQGIVFCEAMAVGKPIVATNVGGIPYVVGHGVNGLLSPYGDVDAFARNIVQVLTDKTLYNYFHQNNLIKAADYRWCSITDTIANLYRN